MVHSAPRCGALLVTILLVAAAGRCRKGDGHDGHLDRPAGANEPAVSEWFTEITEEVGLDFVHDTGAIGELHMPEIMASGVALFDYDNDRDLDIYLVNGAYGLSRGDTPESVQAFTPKTHGFHSVGAGPVNRLYRQGPDGGFVDVTAESGLGDPGYGMGVAIGDIDNDADLDVYLTNLGGDRLYRNRGDGTFEDITVAAGIDVDGWSCSAAFFDYDRDGFLDLYVTRYLKYAPRVECSDFAGRRDYCGPKSFPPANDVLLHNNADGTFTDVSKRAGIASMAAAGLGVICEDFNLDGWPDIYVANDGYPNNLWINRGDGTFVDEALLMGVALNWHGVAEAGMGVIAGDFDNDHDLDLFMTHIRRESNTLYRNTGSLAGFEDATAAAGLESTSVPYTGFGTAAFDVELDGDLDLVVVNGRVLRADPLDGVRVPSPWDMYAEPNLFYLNDGTGRFDLVEPPVRSLCTRIEVTRGLAMGDIDNDGDIDLLISNGQGPARLYRNDAPRRGHWLMIRAMDPALGRDAIGAQVTVVCGTRRFLRTITRGFSYLSSSDSRAHFGLGEADRIDDVIVVWPDGQRERFTPPLVDRVVPIIRGTSSVSGGA